MADYSIKAVFSADDAGFSAAFQQAAKVAKELESGTGKMFQTIGGGVANAGKALMAGLSVPLAGIGVASAKAAIDFESAMTGVAKTVDMTEEEFQAMSKSVQEMSRELPASTTEIAAVAEAAGQLGIEKENILSFTRTMIDMGEATNLSSDEAATALARFANITGMSQDQFSNLGSAVVDLGNNFATTEAEIVEMGMRLAGTGSQVGLSQAEIMGLATAMSSVGIQAEAGGTAMSMVMTKINKAVGAGGEGLEKFANVAEMSAADFAEAWRTNPTVALEALVNGLSYAQQSGKNMDVVLEELGIKGIRETDTMKRLAGASHLLGDAFDTATTAFEENTALSKEAETRYATLAAKISILKNAFVEAGQKIGDLFSPALESIVEKITAAVQAFSDMDPAMQMNIAKIAALVAAIGPAVLILGKLTSGIGVAMQAMTSFSGGFQLVSQGAALASTASGGFASALGGIAAKAGGVVASSTPVIAVIAGVAAVLTTAWNESETFRNAVTQAFEAVKSAAGDFGGKLKSAFEKVSSAVTPILSAFEQLWSTVVSAISPALSVLANVAGTVLSSAFGILGSIVSSVASVFSGLSPVVSGILSILSGLASVVGAVLSPVLTVFASIIGTVVTYISKFIEFVASLVEALAGLLAPVLEKVGGLFQGIGNFVSGVGETISGFFEKFGLGADQVAQKSNEVSQEITSSFNEAKTALEEDTQQMTTTTSEQTATMAAEAEKNAMRMRQRMTEEATATKEGVGFSIQQLTASVPADMQMMANNVAMTMEAMGISTQEQANALAEGVGLSWDSVANWTVEDWNRVSQAVLQSTSEIGNAAPPDIQQTVENMNTSWDSAETGAQEAMFGVESAVSEGLSSTAAEAEASSLQIAESTVSNLNSMSQGAQSAMDAYRSAVTEGMNAAASAVEAGTKSMNAAITSAMNSIGNMTSSGMNKATSTITSSMQKMTSAINSGMSAAVSAARSGFSQINQVAQSTTANLNGIIQTFSSNFTRQITQMMSSSLSTFRQGSSQMTSAFQAEMGRIRSLAQSTGNAVVSAFRSIQGSMRSAGVAAGAGFNAGLASQRGRIIGTARSIANAASNTIRNSLKVRSPSRVMIDIGEDTGEGLAVGIDHSKRLVVKAMDGIASYITKNVPTLRKEWQKLGYDLDETFKKISEGGEVAFEEVIALMQLAQDHGLSSAEIAKLFGDEWSLALQKVVWGMAEWDTETQKMTYNLEEMEQEFSKMASAGDEAIKKADAQTSSINDMLDKMKAHIKDHRDTFIKAMIDMGGHGEDEWNNIIHGGEGANGVINSIIEDILIMSDETERAAIIAGAFGDTWNGELVTMMQKFGEWKSETDVGSWSLNQSAMLDYYAQSIKATGEEAVKAATGVEALKEKSKELGETTMESNMAQMKVSAETGMQDIKNVIDKGFFDISEIIDKNFIKEIIPALLKGMQAMRINMNTELGSVVLVVFDGLKRIFNAFDKTFLDLGKLIGESMKNRVIPQLQNSLSTMLNQMNAFSSRVQSTMQEVMRTVAMTEASINNSLSSIRTSAEITVQHANAVQSQVQPMTIYTEMDGKTYRVHVNDIHRTQDSTVAWELAYK